MTFATLRDYFKEADYPKDAKGFTEIPLQDVYDALYHFFPNGWNERVHEGTRMGHAGPIPYVSLELSVISPDGNFSATVNGYAEAPAGSDIGYAGLLSMARRQAALRGLGMGHSLYSGTHEVAELVPVAITPPPPSKPYSTAYTPSGSGSFAGKPFGPWTGERILKNGPSAGKMWKDLRIEDVQRMADKGIGVAKLELDRRMSSGDSAASVSYVIDATLRASQDEALEEALRSPAEETVRRSPFTHR